MAEFNRYWAEEEIGEPYAPQDYSWMKSTRRAGMFFGGVACALTASALLGPAVYHLVDPAPRVSISSYEIDVVTAQRAMPAPSLANPAPNKAPQAPATPRQLQVASAAPQKPALPGRAAPAPSAATPNIRIADAPALPGRALPAGPAGAQDKRQLAKPQLATAGPRPASAPDRSMPAPAGAQDKRLQAKSPDAPAAAKTDPDTRVALSKAADGKPTDIASGDKLGIREILVDGIVMQNGRRVKNGSALPNGEILMGTDAAKGMAETDRRVLVLTP